MTPALPRPEGLTITKLERNGDGIWTARVSLNGQTINVDRRYGSWQALVPDERRGNKPVRREIRPEVAAALQDKVRPIEKKERELAAENAQREKKGLPPLPVDDVVIEEKLESVPPATTWDSATQQHDPAPTPMIELG